MPSQHEMDWLSLKLAKYWNKQYHLWPESDKFLQRRTQEMEEWFRPKLGANLRGLSVGPSERLVWRIGTSLMNDITADDPPPPLWLFDIKERWDISMKENANAPKKKHTESDWLQQCVQSNKQVFRILGQVSEEILASGLVGMGIYRGAEVKTRLDLFWGRVQQLDTSDPMGFCTVWDQNPAGR